VIIFLFKMKLEFVRSLLWLAVSWLEPSLAGWQDNARPRMFLQPRLYTDYQVFEGNKTDPDHMSVLLVDGPHLLIGARNTVYKLSIRDMKVRQVLEWSASEQDRNVCLVKGKSELSCQNYIKVLKKFENDAGRYLICGTNAFKPECREYVEDAGSYLMTKKSKGVGLCPYSPDHNSTSVLVQDKLYAGTAADYQGVDPIIYRDPLRSPQFDSTYLNNPSFVGSFDDEHFVYFFFREGAVEYMNCGKSVFSRVARVCKNDLGGTRSLNAKWTSFLKARLNCSVPGVYPFYFDEIQDISPLIRGEYGDKVEQVVYATFTTPPNSIGGSAVCVFRLADIAATFAGRFKEQRSTGENWLAVESHRVPDPRPGSCPNNSKELSDATYNFIKTHPLMDGAVPPFLSSPVLLRTGFNIGFTAIGIHPQVATPDGSKFDVIFVGTSGGQLLKAVNSLSPKSRQSARPVIIEELAAVTGAVRSVTVVPTKKGGGHVLVAAAEEIKQFSLYRCGKAVSCRDCVALQDPYCAWDTSQEVCAGAQSWAKGSQAVYLQSVVTGEHESCPGPPGPSLASDQSQQQAGTVINQVGGGAGGGAGRGGEIGTGTELAGADRPTVEASVVLFGLETLIITVSAGAVAALVVGFVTGYCCGRKCQKEESNVPYADAEYEYFEQRQLPARPVQPGMQPLLQHTDYKRPQEETLYAEPILINHNVNASNPLGTTLARPSYAAPGTVAGMTLASTGFTHPGLHPTNKFNTISNVHKRGGRQPGGYNFARGVAGEETQLGGDQPGNHYERGNLLLNRQPRNFQPGEVGVSSGANTVYHMGTLSRASKNRESDREKNSQQVVDSAYGTTRSVKKVYL